MVSLVVTICEKEEAMEELGEGGTGEDVGERAMDLRLVVVLL